MQGTFETRAQIASTFDRQSQIQQAQIDLEELLRLQIDEENSLRGYLLTRDPFYVAQYHEAASGYDAKQAAIRRTLQRAAASRSRRATRHVRAPAVPMADSRSPRRLLRNPGTSLDELDKRNKLFSDYETRTVAAIRQILAGTDAALVAQHATVSSIGRRTCARFGSWFSACSPSSSTPTVRASIESSKRSARLPRSCSAPTAANPCRCRTAKSAAHTSRRRITWRSAATSSTSSACPIAARSCSSPTSAEKASTLRFSPRSSSSWCGRLRLRQSESGRDPGGVQPRVFQGRRQSISIRFDVRRRARYDDVQSGVRERRTRLRFRQAYRWRASS